MDHARSLRQSLVPLVASVVGSILVTLCVLVLRNWGNLETLELVAYDWLLRSRAQAPATASRVAVITVTEKDIQEHDWPLKDAILARALEALERLKPRAIGLDIYRDIPVPPGSEELTRVFKNNPSIIVTMRMAEGSSATVAAPTALRNTPQVSFNDLLVDRDGIVRRGLLFLDDGKATVYSFALRLALVYLQAEGIVPQPDTVKPERLRLGSVTLSPLEGNDGSYIGADARGYQFLIDYADARRPLPSFDLASLLAGRINPDLLRDKIVIIGTKAESVPDIFHTPLSSESITGDRMTGMELHGMIAGQLLRHALDGASATKVLSETLETSWILFWGVLGSTVGIWSISPWRYWLLIVSGFVVITISAYGAFLLAWWVPLVPPAIAWLGSAAFATAYQSYQEKTQRTLLMQLFARHVSAEVADTIWQHREQFLDGQRPRPQQLTATVLFTDMVNFTTLAEKQDPLLLMAWLNEYMEAMAQQVTNHHGVIKQFIGDSIMAIFGVPVPRLSETEIAQDAVHAVSCALNMGETLTQLNRNWHAAGRPPAAMRIGVFTGPMIVGSLGSSQRLEYTVIGDAVNTASRLESFEKERFEPDVFQYPCRVLIGASTYHYVREYFVTEKLGEVILKGKNDIVTVYRVVSRNDPGAALCREEARDETSSVVPRNGDRA